MSNTKSFSITLFSFGYKYDPPKNVNFLFDVRFLANPFHDKKLRSFTGLKACISDFVLENDSGRECLQHLHRITVFHATQLQQSGKEELQIAIGCTGGHHRSVAVIEALAKLLKNDFTTVNHFHRDITKESH
ncbi:MAG: hypothetical protein KAR01_02745 [Desulfocapsa sp.]|nr:hypothetical protein [Desulfocapsa sp.]